MKSEVFEPLGMTSSTFLVNEVDKDELSDCFTWTGKIEPYRVFTALAAASLFTNCSDITKFVKIFLTNPNGEIVTNGLVSQQSILSMREVQIASGEYGLGTVLYEKTASGDFIFGHTGNNYPAVNTIVLINPGTNDAIILLSTGSNRIASSLGNYWIKWQLN